MAAVVMFSISALAFVALSGLALLDNDVNTASFAIGAAVMCTYGVWLTR